MTKEEVVVVVIAIAAAAEEVEAAVSTDLLRLFPSYTILDALSAVTALWCQLFVMACEHLLYSVSCYLQSYWITKHLGTLVWQFPLKNFTKQGTVFTWMQVKVFFP